MGKSGSFHSKWPATKQQTTKTYEILCSVKPTTMYRENMVLLGVRIPWMIL